jgi:nitric oxide reductase subunit B
MKQTLLDKFMSRKGLYTGFWIIALIMVSMLIYYTANLQKEVPPIPKEVKSVSGEVLYTYDDVIAGKGYFQQFDLMDWGTMLGMGAYMGPDFSTDFLHYRAEFLYDFYAGELYGKTNKELSTIERGAVKERVKQDFRQQTKLLESTTIYTDASAAAYKSNVKYLTKMLVEGDPSRAFKGGIIRPDEAVKIAAFVDWAQLVASSYRTGTQRTWSNNWPPEPMIDQDLTFLSHKISLWEFLLLWTLTIIVIFLAYEFLFKKDENDKLEEPLKITKLFHSQKKLLKYIPIVGALFVVQLIIGGYLAHLIPNPAKILFSLNHCCLLMYYAQCIPS